MKNLRDFTFFQKIFFGKFSKNFFRTKVFNIFRYFFLLTTFSSFRTTRETRFQTLLKNTGRRRARIAKILTAVHRLVFARRRPGDARHAPGGYFGSIRGPHNITSKPEKTHPNFQTGSRTGSWTGSWSPGPGPGPGPGLQDRVLDRVLDPVWGLWNHDLGCNYSLKFGMESDGGLTGPLQCLLSDWWNCLGTSTLTSKKSWSSDCVLCRLRYVLYPIKEFDSIGTIIEQGWFTMPVWITCERNAGTKDYCTREPDQGSYFDIIL